MWVLHNGPNDTRRIFIDAVDDERGTIFMAHKAKHNLYSIESNTISSLHPNSSSFSSTCMCVCVCSVSSFRLFTAEAESKHSLDETNVNFTNKKKNENDFYLRRILFHLFIRFICHFEISRCPTTDCCNTVICAWQEIIRANTMYNSYARPGMVSAARILLCLLSCFIVRLSIIYSNYFSSHHIFIATLTRTHKFRRHNRKTIEMFVFSSTDFGNRQIIAEMESMWFLFMQMVVLHLRKGGAW